MIRQQYRNEFRAKKRKKFFQKFLAVFFVALIGSMGIIYGLFFAKFFNINSITINGIESVERADIDSAVSAWLSAKFFGIARGNNSVFLSSDKLRIYLESKFLKLASVSVTKKLPHRLDIVVSERKPVGIWCLPASKCFYFDKNAIAYATTGGSAGFLLATISDLRNREIELGSSVVSGPWFEDIFLAKDLLEKNGIALADVVIPADSFDEFDVKTAEGLPGQGWKIMFSNQTDLGKQIKALSVFLKEKIKPDQRAKLQYVDLRIQDRIYYK